MSLFGHHTLLVGHKGNVIFNAFFFKLLFRSHVGLFYVFFKHDFNVVFDLAWCALDRSVCASIAVVKIL